MNNPLTVFLFHGGNLVGLMMIALLIAGICAVLAGLLAILLGIPVKEFSFGNTLILAGAVAVCSGTIVLALALVVRELRIIARRLGPRGESRARPLLAPVTPPSAQPAGEDEPLFPRDRRTPVDAGLPFSDARARESWRGDTATSDRTRQEPTVPRPGTAEAALPARRRNLLFSSTARKDRDRAQAHSGEAEPSGDVDAPVPETGESPSASLQSRGLEPQRRTSRSPLGVADVSTGPGAADRPAPAAQNEDQPAVTVIKSGLVDGMAYSLYSDGSIEAQMPEGMMRFASIDELRAHLDQRP